MPDLITKNKLVDTVWFTCTYHYLHAACMIMFSRWCVKVNIFFMLITFVIEIKLTSKHCLQQVDRAVRCCALLPRMYRSCLRNKHVLMVMLTQLGNTLWDHVMTHLCCNDYWNVQYRSACLECWWFFQNQKFLTGAYDWIAIDLWLSFKIGHACIKYIDITRTLCFHVLSCHGFF